MKWLHTIVVMEDNMWYEDTDYMIIFNCIFFSKKRRTGQKYRAELRCITAPANVFGGFTLDNSKFKDISAASIKRTFFGRSQHRVETLWFACIYTQEIKNLSQQMIFFFILYINACHILFLLLKLILCSNVWSFNNILLWHSLQAEMFVSFSDHPASLSLYGSQYISQLPS